MAPYSLWLFVLFAIVIPLHLAAKDEVATTLPPPEKPLKFMASRFTYLNLTTLDLPDVTCTKAATIWNSSTRTFTQYVLVKSDGNWLRKDVNYKPIWKTIRPLWLQGFTFLNKTTNETTTYTLNYTMRDCAVINKQIRNKTGGVESEGWELWVNDAYFRRNHTNEEFCRMHYMNVCKCGNSTRKVYSKDECEGNPYKLILVS
uniref:Lipocalin n=1 Tax=Rhipicephalus zambeziensis TaxID=60191 RepID=A0A224YI21_9ACAR